jgi:hypothetical protein
VAGIAAVILVLLGGVALWALSSGDGSLRSIMGGPTPTPVPPPTPTPAPTATPQPGIGIQIPGPQGTPTTVTIPIPSLPVPVTITIPTIVIPTLPISIAPPATSTAVAGAKMTADQARQKVKDSLSNCQLLQVQIDIAQVTYEAPNWLVRLPLSGATWRVDDNTGEITTDDRAAERQRLCRL